MTDFNKIITDKITEMENSGTIQKIVEEKILEIINSAIDKCFSWDFKEQITKQIKESVGDIASIKKALWRNDCGSRRKK